VVTPGVTADRGLRRAWPSCPCRSIVAGCPLAELLATRRECLTCASHRWSASPAQQSKCWELQWWFAVPQVGEQTQAAWYDRDTGELTRVRETTEPAIDAGLADGSVAIDIDEWNRQLDGSLTYQKISILAALTAERAEFRGVTIGAHSTKPGDDEFASSWAGGGPRRVLDDGRFRQIGERCYRTTTATGMGAGLVEVTVDNRRFRCLRALDLPTTDGSNEIGQSLIDLDTGRTVAYWQYRPTGWDADAADWLGRHSGVEIVVDDITYQRRNCTGRDEVALTHLALGLV